MRDLQEQKAVAVREAMRAVEALVKDSKAEIAREAASAGQALEGEAAAVADQIVESILGRRAA